MKNKITLSGLAGSGKTTIGKMLADKLSYKFVSIGNFSRELAKNEFDMDINKFQEHCKKNPNIDKKIDEQFAGFCNLSNNIIIDYRLAYHFVKSSFNVFLKVSETEAVSRLLNANRTEEFTENNEELIKTTMNVRNEKMRQRFMQSYGTDFTEENNYDLVIDTNKYSKFEEICELIIENFKRK